MLMMLMNRGRHGTRGGALVLIIVTALCLLALWAVVWFLILLATGQLRNTYAQLGTPQQPVWVQLKGNQMRQAASAADLETAEWASPRERGWGYTAFAPIDVPSEGMDVGIAVDAARVGLVAFGSWYDAEWEYEKRDEAKARWEYMVSAPLETARSPEEAVLNEPPRLEKPVLELDTEVGREEGQSTIGVALWLDTDDWGIEEIRRNGQPVEVQVRILDSTGKEVASETGSLEDFGYT
jgi:hypothetical protein